MEGTDDSEAIGATEVIKQQKPRNLRNRVDSLILYLFPSQWFFLLGFALQGFNGDISARKEISQEDRNFGRLDGRDDL